MEPMPAANLVKSKSSNSGIIPRSQKKKDKKTRSSAEFQIQALKKRGVYVEKKCTKMNIQTYQPNVQMTMQNKPPPRPKPGQKKFIASIFTILSKSTAGTQHPSVTEKIIEPKKEGIQNDKVKKGRKKSPKLIDVDTTYEDEACSHKNEKNKYRSRALNSGCCKDKINDFVVLQSKKHIEHTPSNYSQSSTKEFQKWDLPLLVKRDEDTKPDSPIKSDLGKHIHNAVHEGIIKTVDKGNKNIKAGDREVNKEPSTLVAHEVRKKDDNKFYNFFVDLLETTFSAYNINLKNSTTKAPNKIPSDISSFNALEIDESVVKKLNVKKEFDLTPEMYDDITQKPSKGYYISNNEEFWNDRRLLETYKSKPMSPESPRSELPLKPSNRNRKNVKAESALYVNNPKMITTKTRSVSITQKRSRKNNKRYLLNLLKEQLKIENDVFVEPRNLYQALKIMARNKRRYQKIIRFDENPQKKDDGFDSECIFRRRKIISPSIKFNNNKKIKNIKQDFVPKSSLASKKYSKNDIYKCPRSKYSKRSEFTDDGSVSHRSLEVYGYDYETNSSKRQDEISDKNILLTYRSSVSVNDHSLYI